MSETIRLAELTGAIARAADAGIGFPPETSLRLCLVAVALARGIGLSDDVALRGRCEVAIRFSVRLGLGPRVERALDEAFERWDGKGLPNGRKGKEVSLTARIISLAELAASCVAVGGVAGAREVVVARSGGQVVRCRVLEDTAATKAAFAS
jgi:hypothetical protein